MQNRDKQNLRLAGALFVLAFLMVAVSFAVVPLYDLFCRVTGYGGATDKATALPATVLERKVNVRFNADTARGMPWIFRPEEVSVDVNLGQGGITSFYAFNRTDQVIKGTALYNVSPPKAGKYFKKIQCFCFDEQTLNPKQDIHMPVYFYIDPAMNDDPFLDDVKTITLSYTFFKAESQELDGALDKFYEENLDSETIKSNTTKTN